MQIVHMLNDISAEERLAAAIRILRLQGIPAERVRVCTWADAHQRLSRNPRSVFVVDPVRPGGDPVSELARTAAVSTSDLIVYSSFSSVPLKESLLPMILKAGIRRIITPGVDDSGPEIASQIIEACGAVKGRSPLPGLPEHPRMRSRPTREPLSFSTEFLLESREHTDVRVLLVDDDPRFSRMIERFFSRREIELALASSGEAGLELARTTRFDAIILDLTMPGWDGFETLERMRGEGIDTPVLVLTGSHSTENVVRALEEGGDDFVQKPVEMVELIARVRAIARRGPAQTTPRLTVGRLEIDPVAHRSHWDGEPIGLTRTELRLLHALAVEPGDVVTRDELRTAGWGPDDDPGDAGLGVHISNLRRRLAAVGAGGLVETVRGRGYRLSAD